MRRAAESNARNVMVGSVTERLDFFSTSDSIYSHMSNLAIEDPDKLEELPSRDKIRPTGVWHRWGEDYPYRKVHRFLTSRIGRFWNDVFSEFCHLDWVPRQYKTRDQIAHTVILNTFMKDGKVWYYDRYLSENERCIEDFNEMTYYSRQEAFYVHPQTGKLCYKQKKGGRKAERRRSDAERAKWFRILGDYHQLLKIDGVWYEVKGEPQEPDWVEVNGLHYKYIKESTIEQHEFKMGVGVKVLDRNDIGYVRINGRLAVPYREARWEGKPLGPKDCMIDGVPQYNRHNENFYWNRKDYKSVRIVVNRQLNGKELKKYGLSNDPKVDKHCKVCGNARCVQNHYKA